MSPSTPVTATGIPDVVSQATGGPGVEVDVVATAVMVVGAATVVDVEATVTGSVALGTGKVQPAMRASVNKITGRLGIGTTLAGVSGYPT